MYVNIQNIIYIKTSETHIHRNFSKGNTYYYIILECNHCPMKYKHWESGPTTSLLYHLKVSNNDTFLYIILIS